MNTPLNFTGCTISSYDYRCFDKLTAEEMKLVSDHSVTIRYRKGEMICKQGGFVSQMMYMEDGLGKIFIEDGKNTLLLRIVPGGSFIGLTSASEEFTTFPYSAQAYVDSVVRQVDIKVFRHLIATNTEFAGEIIKILSANSIQIHGRFFCLTYKQAYGRMADILLCLAGRIFRQNKFDLPLSRKEIAELSGMSTETVVRMLKKFNDEGLINMSGKSFELLDVEKLQRITETG